MADDLDLTFQANSRGLQAGLQALEAACEAWKLDADVISRARIVFEELFTNTIKYGYGGECDRAVRLCLSAHDGLRMTYEDDAPSFDPTRWQAPGDEPDMLHRKREGQAGVAMVLGLCSTVHYLAIDGGNRLTLTLEFAPR